MEPTVFDTLVTCGRGRLKPEIHRTTTLETTVVTRPVWDQDPTSEMHTKTGFGNDYDGWDFCQRPTNWEYYHNMTTAPRNETVCFEHEDNTRASSIVHKFIPSADDPEATKLLQ